jgi:hypothetical protein
MDMIRSFIVMASICALLVPSLFAADTLPRELSDDAFWKLMSDYSEESGQFRFEYMSNEQEFQVVIPRLIENRKPGGVYVGVGPEQNFTYIAALQPKMAFIVDIRRDNMLEQLIYKTVFEMSANRAEFLSHLFSRKMPAGLTEKTTARALFQAFRASSSDAALFHQNLQAIKDRLLTGHKFRLSLDDVSQIDYIYRVFFDAGSESTGNAFTPSGQNVYFGTASYADLMTATDNHGEARSYLANEENFRIIRDMERKNLIVPIVGNFAGAKALRNVGRYIKDHNAAVAAMYTSNVEQYLYQQGDDWRKFLGNVATFPLDGQSMFIRSSHFAYGDTRQPPRQASGRRFLQLLSPMAEVVKAFNAGKITGYEDVIQLSR